MSELSLSLLGSFRAELNGRSLHKFRTSKVQALLIYLTVENGDPVSRNTLMGLLWPDLPRHSAQLNLRQTVYQLRKLLAELSIGEGDTAVSFLISERLTIGIHPEAAYTVDVQTFNQHLQAFQTHTHADLLTCTTCQKQLEQAVALYRGDFLADFYLADSNIFEEWAMVKRETYRRQALDALETVTSIYLHQHNYQRAQKFAQQQIEIDNLRENGYRQLMESLARNGQRNDALAQYEMCRRQLSKELGMAPTAHTTRLYAQIKAGELGLTPAQPNKIRGYKLLEEIDAGSFGAVHRAIQPMVEREVAIKIILPQHANRADFIRRFEAEAHMVARLEHPHIVPLYDYWREPDGAYLVMRLLRGGNLEKLLQKAPMELETAVTLVDQIASALATAHRQGIIHRDLKPANILLDEEGNAYLSDFGIAKNLESDQLMTGKGDILGSPAYISPEQVLSEKITTKTDIYSFGIILYTLLTGTAPFPEASLVTLIHNHLNEPLPLVRQQNTNVPPQVDTVIQKATAKKPDGRYPDVNRLARAFREAIEQAGIVTLPPITDIPPITTTTDAPNPYQGLRPFQETDSTHFFGRTTLINQLLTRLTAQSPNPPISQSPPHRFLAVVGPSGSGKSSVVKAGLIPALRQGAIPGSENWFIVEMTPGDHPLEELEAALLHVAVNPPPSLIEPLQKDERGLIRTVKRILPHDQEDKTPSELLLLIDQFEELFTLVEDDAVRTHFLDSLVTAVTDPRTRLRIIITLRADFYDHPLQHPGLGELLRQYTELILPLNATELEQAISGPAQTVGVTPEPGLIAAITADVNEQPGALPLLQYALTELYERRDGRLLTQAAYTEIGGVSGALSRRAEEIYQSLDETAQESARQLFLRLVTLGEGIEDTRRRVLQSELEALNTDDDSFIHHSPFTIHHSPLIPPLHPSSFILLPLQEFGQYRLLSFDRDPITRSPTVEVAHEALLREWDRLRGWLDESRDDVRWQRRLAAAAREWHHANQDDGYLLRGSRLDQFAGWAAGAKIALTQDEQGYLETSVTARDQRQAEEAARQQRELETARQLAATEKSRAEEQSQAAQRLQRRAVYLVGVLVVAVLFAIAAGLFGQQSRRNANLAATSQAEAVTNAQLAVTREADAVVNANLASTREVEAQDSANMAATSEAEAITSADLAAQAADAEAAAAAEAQTQQTIAEANAREALASYSQSLAAHAQNALDEGDTAVALALALAANDLEHPPELSQLILRQAAYAPGPHQQYQVAELFPDVDGRIYSL
ncbi:MAG: protein kinase, partial [Aestuariibacter sp.]|nr:protein kinase [Aestuariibacter sp.]